MLLYSLEEAPFIQTFALKSYSILQHHQFFEEKFTIMHVLAQFGNDIIIHSPILLGGFYSLKDVICFLILISIYVFPYLLKGTFSICFGLVETPHSNSNLLHFFKYFYRSNLEMISQFHFLILI